MTIAVNNLIDRARLLLQDANKVRWPDSELLGWLNDGQREVVIYKPSANTTTGTHECVAGTRQTLPAAALQLIDIPRNTATGGEGRAVRMVERTVLDAEMPRWHVAPKSIDIINYCYDIRTPNTFYVYPPATTTARLEIIYSVAPSDASLGGNINIPDVYANVLIDYMLYRAFAKDSDFAGSAELSASYYNRAMQALGVKTGTEVTNGPRREFNRASSPDPTPSRR